ncbi:hypothetical protein [Aeromonas jandaei]
MRLRLIIIITVTVTGAPLGILNGSVSALNKALGHWQRAQG